MTDLRLDMPPVAFEADARPVVGLTLGWRREISSRVSAGVSDVAPLDAAEARLLRPSGGELVRLTLRASFRPAEDEQFERVLVSVLLQGQDRNEHGRPLAFKLTPARLVSGPYTVSQGWTIGAHAGTTGLEATAEASGSTRAEQRPPYVVAAGEGESDPEWRYQRTETMSLEGSHEMGMLVELQPTVVQAEAFISLAGTVTAGGQKVGLTWELDDRIARVPLRRAA